MVDDRLLKKFLERLRASFPNYVSYNGIKDEFGAYPKVHQFLQVSEYARGLGYVKNSGSPKNQRVKITPDGIDFLKKEKSDRIRNFHSWAMLIATLVIAGSAYMSYIVSVNYYNAYTISLIPNTVALNITLKDRIFSLHNIADNESFSERAEVCITNLGRVPSGRVNWGWVSNWTTYCSGYDDIENLNTGESKCVSLCVRCDQCIDYLMKHSEMNTSFIEPGKNEMELEVSCEYCDADYLKKFDVCIWEDSTRDCGDFQ